MSSKAIAKLREKLNTALRKEKFKDAQELYRKLQEAEPDEPRWPHRHGDLLRRLGKEALAIRHYELAVHRYAQLGFVARAAAMAKVIIGIDPARVDVLERVDPEAARQLHQAKGRKAAAKELGSLRKSAVALTPAADADDDEIRFGDVDEDDDFPELIISDAELEVVEAVEVLDEDDVLLLDLDEEPKRPNAETLADLPAMPLFSDVPPDALRRLLLESELIDRTAGEVLFAQGDPSDALYIIVEGAARAEIPDRDPVLLREGDLIGESCLLDEVTRSATVRAHGNLQTLRISKALLDNLVDTFSEVGDVLFELLSRRQLSNLLLTSPIFLAFDTATRAELAKLFEVRRADPDTIILQSGKRSDGLYCPLVGKVIAQPGDLEVPLGRIIGQRSLLSHAPAEHSVSCESETLLLRMPASRFNELAALYPPVLEYLTQLATQPLDDY